MSGYIKCFDNGGKNISKDNKMAKYKLFKKIKYSMEQI